MRNAFLGKVRLNQGKKAVAGIICPSPGTFADVQDFSQSTLSVLDILLMLLKAWSSVESKSSHYLLSATPKS